MASSQFKTAFRKSAEASKARVHNYKARRPHRSFRLTQRRDYRRSLELPGYFAFTHEVNRTVWKFRRPLLVLVAVFIVVSGVFIGIGSQENYDELRATLQESSEELLAGDVSQLGEAVVTFAAVATNGVSEAPTEVQQVLSALIFLVMWLATIWLLRNLLAGHKVKVRDGLYNSGAPIVSTAVVVGVMLLQLLPLLLAAIGYSLATSTGLLVGGVEAMLFWMVFGLLAAISLYWITSTFFALIVVTLPGMYPWQALRTAGDLVVGRRMRIVLRLVWMVLCVTVAWALILIPAILIDAWIKSLLPAIAWWPGIPFLLLVISTATTVWVTSYIYILYRKVVDDDAKPA